MLPYNSLYKNPLDLNVLNDIWFKINQNNVYLNSETLQYLLFDIFMSLFKELWSDKNLYMNLENYINDLNDKKEILDILEPIIKDKHKDINLMYDEGYKIIEQFFLLFKDVKSLDIYQINEYIFNQNGFVSLFKKVATPNMSFRNNNI